MGSFLRNLSIVNDKDLVSIPDSLQAVRDHDLDSPADQETGSYNTKHKPCDFLDDQGNCILGDCVPQNCLDYPYTDKPDRMESLLSFLEAVAVCPVAYEICERLKGHYGFQ
jgi:hypothetical protein